MKLTDEDRKAFDAELAKRQTSPEVDLRDAQREAHRLRDALRDSEARVAELESVAHEIAASIPVEDWGPAIDGGLLCREVKAMASRCADAEAEFDLLRAAGNFLASRNDGLCPSERGEGES